eukprot:CAMPEP_0183760296 /NCGR_PEP_ID=MMETSP0739-20130205/7676_1 /TAXON_ID=385413 /ORGANISM="Thalassiosira miniscula, Strain CCMP1093" /LENGTH=76 /DNA_ID=CAMNT_0025998261 /DNA_START=155 /DNA_END=385 /DNA_ORIENTATION=+
MIPYRVMPRPIAQCMIRRPRPQRLNPSEPMFPKRIRLGLRARALFAIRARPAVAPYVLAPAADPHAALARADVVAS